MISRKGYLAVEFMIVVLIFMLILLSFTTSFNTIIPSEVGKIRSSTACSEAQLLSDAMFNFPGENDTWQLGSGAGNLTRLGFSTSEAGVLNYSKWVAAQNMSYLMALNKTGLNRSFVIEYSTYVIKPPATLGDYLSNKGPKENAEIYFGDGSNKVGVYARNVDGERLAVLNMELFFPAVTIDSTEQALPESAVDAEDSVTTSNTAAGGTAKITFKLVNDSDQVRFTLSAAPALVFIKNMDFRSVANISNRSVNQNFPVYYRRAGVSGDDSCSPENCPKNGTLLKDSFGSSGSRDPSKHYCESKRKLVIVNGTDKIGVDISVLVER